MMFLFRALIPLIAFVPFATALAIKDSRNTLSPNIPHAKGLAVTGGVANPSLPVHYGMLLYPSFQALDVFGPLDMLTMLSLTQPTTLSIIAETLDPVSTVIRSPDLNKVNSTFGESVVPTHTFETAPDLDVLMIPGGPGSFDPTPNTIDFIRKTYPKVKYLITVCTGSWLAGDAGVLDGKNATSNKALWDQVGEHGHGVHWIAKARWVKDGNIYTTSGVSAGIDGALAFVEEVYGKDMADALTQVLEYDRHTDASYDPWGDFYNLTDVYN